MEKEKYLQNVFEQNFFWVASGEQLKNLEDLANALENMSDEIFKHHVNENKNDFCCWIHDCIGDNVLAETLITIQGKSNAAKKIKDRIKELKNSKKSKPVEKAVEKVVEKVIEKAVEKKQAAPAKKSSAKPALKPIKKGK